jgi:hypothetical protein
MGSLLRYVVGAVLVAIVSSPGRVESQASHLSPAYQKRLPSATELLAITRKAGGSLPTGTSVLVVGNQLIFEVPGKGRDIIPLSGRTVGEVADAIQSKYSSDLVVAAKYPMHSAELIGEVAEPSALPFTAIVKPSAPIAALGFGVMFAMADDDNSNSDGLLAQNGFQLDLTGVHQFSGPTSAFYLPQLYVQARLGLTSDQSLNVVRDTTASTNPTGPETGAQFEAAVQQADQIAITAQTELVYPLGNTSVEFAAVPEYGVMWTRLEPIDLPLIVTSSGTVSSAEVFGEDLSSAVLARVNQTIPLTNYGLTSFLRFLRDDRVLFYLGAGYMQKQVIHRGISFRRDPTTREPITDSLRGHSEGVYHGHWRGAFGARIPGIIDVRVDASTPLSVDEVGPPILRLILGKTFPIGES